MQNHDLEKKRIIFTETIDEIVIWMSNKNHSLQKKWNGSMHSFKDFLVCQSNVKLFLFQTALIQRKFNWGSSSFCRTTSLPKLLIMQLKCFQWLIKKSSMFNSLQFFLQGNKLPKLSIMQLKCFQWWKTVSKTIVFRVSNVIPLWNFVNSISENFLNSTS